MVNAKDIMVKDVISMDISGGLEKLIKLMAESKVSSIIILEKEKIVGIVTERDLIKKILLPKKEISKLKLSDVMTKGIVSVQSDTPVHEISELMHQKNIRHLPVIDGGKLVGMVSQRDIVKETHKIHKENVRFMNWQNVQTAIIVTFFIFLLSYLAYNFWFNA